MLTVFSGLASALSYAVSDMLSQRVTRAAGVLRVLLWVLATGTVLVVPVALAIDGWPSGAAEWRAVGLSAAAGVLYLGAYGSLLAGLRRGDLSLVAALSSLQGAFTAVLAMLGGEPVTPMLVVGLVLATIGGVLAAVQGRAKSATGAGWAILCGLLFAFVMVLYDRADGVSWLTQAAVSRFTSFLLMVPLCLIFAGGASVARQHRATVIGAGVLEVAGLVLVTVSIALGPLSIAGIAASQFGTFAVVLGLVFLRERPRPHQLVGVGCTLVAVTVLAALGQAA